MVRRARTARAFTLLEIMFAVAILALMSISIYRFVQTNVTAMRISTETNLVDAQYSGLVSLLSSTWGNLAPGDGALLGEPLKLDDRSRDEITWTCGAGPGLLTRFAGGGEYRVSLLLRPSARKDRQDIGFMRKKHDRTRTEDSGEGSWVPILPNVQSLQIRYFDPRLNTWVDKWTDTFTLPRVVKLIIGRPDNPVPWEADIALARTSL